MKSITKLADFIDRLYIEPVYKVSVWFIMSEFKACEVFKIKEFTVVNDCFKYEHNVIH